MKTYILLLIFIVLQNTLHGQSAKPKTDAQKKGLVGKVASVKLKNFIATEMNGKIQKGDLIDDPHGEKYDKTGHKIEDIYYDRHETIVEKWVYTFDLTGNITDGKRYDSTGTVLWNFTNKYNIQGQLIEGQHFEYGELLEVTTYKSDDKGNLIEESSASGDGLYITVNKYDAKGNKIEIKSTDPNNEVYWHESYSFDSRFNVTEKISYDSKVKIADRTVFKYDSSGKLIEKFRYNSTDLLVDHIKYTNDKFGNVIEEISNTDNSQSYKITYTYVYDKIGNWTSKTNYVDNKVHSIAEREITYY